MKVVLVTGSDGFVGKHLCQALKEAGYEVISGSRLTLGNLENLSETALIGLKIDSVVHAAARAHVMKNRANNPDHAFYLANVLATQQLAKAAAKAHVKQFIFLSTIKVNGEYTTTAPFTAEDMPNPQDAYARSKYAAEQWLNTFGSEQGLSVVSIRPPLLYGPGAKGHWAQLERWVERGWPLPFGRIQNARSVLGVDKLCQLIIHMISHPEIQGTFLAADPNPLSTPDLIRYIAHGLGKEPKLWSIPVGWLTLAGYLTGTQDKVKKLTQSLVVQSGGVSF
jgi:nucleoside-diphosphate-sugar epimerase